MTHHRNVILRTVARNIYTAWFLVLMLAMFLLIYIYNCLGG